MDADTLEQVARIARDAETGDGVAALDEATWLTLRHRPEAVQVQVDQDGFALVAGEDLSLVVAPAARGRGVGAAILADVLAHRDGPLHAWSHGDHPAAAALARRTGFDRVRELWVMRRPAAEPLPELVVPADLTVRGYRDSDADALLAVNAAAFAHHPEQGSMDAAALAERMAEPWFDPAGLLVATDAEALLGFHWTKQHSPEVGEVYVVGVDPRAQGRGLGRLLTLAGLHHLAGLGVEEVLLYVESDNRPAIATYAGLGFTHAGADTHVMYHRDA